MEGSIPAYSDFFVKYLFGSPENSDSLLDFLNSVQEYHGFPRLTKTTVLNPYNLQEVRFGKLSILDIKAEDDSGRLYNIEIQASRQPNYKERSLYYWAKLYASQLQEGEAYTLLEPTISINILNFELLENLPRAENCFLLMHKDEPNVVLTDQLVMHYIELPKLKQTSFESKLEKWAAFFKYEGTTEETMKVLLSDEALARAHEWYQRFNQDKEARIAHEDRMKSERDMAAKLADAVALGRAEGELKKALSTAQKLLALGVPLDVVLKSTGLTDKDLSAL